jgi:hypothetical protein
MRKLPEFLTQTLHLGLERGASRFQRLDPAFLGVILGVASTIP